MNIELEERTCKGGCGEKFKVLPSSKIEYAKKNCFKCKRGDQSWRGELDNPKTRAENMARVREVRKKFNFEEANKG